VVELTLPLWHIDAVTGGGVHPIGYDPGAGTRRVRAARRRAATEREQRIERALKVMQEIDKSLSGKSKKRQPETTPADTTRDETARTEAVVEDQSAGEQPAEEQPKDPKEPKKPKEPRGSTTDHDACMTKIADGGFRPAFNAQLAVDTETLIITGVDLINSGSDMNQMLGVVQKRLFSGNTDERERTAGIGGLRVTRTN